jgi:superfamily II DNA or RNA helicase
MEEYFLDYNEFRESFANGEYKLVIASQVMDEGMDIPSIGAVIMGGGGKSRIKLTQRLGRGLRRKTTGLNRVYIVDFMDRTHVFLNAHSKKRKKFYEDAGALMIADHYQFNVLAHQHGQQLNEN